MVQYKPLNQLPTQEDLPETDFAPVDSELQVLVASLLGDILAWHWRDRADWFWGANLGVYFDPERPAIAPDGLLSLGVDRLNRSGGRLSYVIWQEGKPPILALEHVSHIYRQEYGEKMAQYARMGVLYYAVFNPEHADRYQHDPLEIYRLEGERYVLQHGEPVWLPEVGLGLGRSEGTYRGWQREWLYWYDKIGNRLKSTAEIAEETTLRANKYGQLRE